MLQTHPVPAFSDLSSRVRGRRCPSFFCGDTRFGCGRVFEGTHPMMHAALARLASLPAAHCASELDYGDAVFAAGRAWKDGFRG